MELRQYQIKAVNDIYGEWNKGSKNVCMQLPTGSGKTAVLASIMRDFSKPSIAIAHRTELIAQLSLALAQYGVYHNIIAPRESIKEIVTLHSTMFGQSYYDPQAMRYVAGVLTLINHKHVDKLAKRIGLFVVDEAHHCLRENSWGKIAALFSQAYGLFPTATPQRSDGKGLGRHADGVIDSLIIGIGMKELIQQGYLTNYRVFAPPNSLDLSTVNITASGEYSPPKLRMAVHNTSIVGNCVEHYERLAPGELGITFAVDIESSIEIANAYRNAGITAETISSKTPTLVRASIMRRFRNHEILQLVNVDILGEGVDVPAVTVVSMCRPSNSLNLVLQQMGRCLRPDSNKPNKISIIIDHVGNTVRHGLPDTHRVWSLDRRERRSTSVVVEMPLKTCLNINCMSVYPRTQRVCPYCGYYTPPRQRSTPDEVEGDLLELSPDVLAIMRGEIARVDGTVRVPQSISTIAQLGVANRHKHRQEAQRELREAIAQWAGYQHAVGKTDSEIHREFYFRFGIDILSAQVLGVTEANALRTRIDKTSTMK